ncbi:MAG: hypothetical protein IJS71_01070 [Clostridia bacterium]|nr:hypothetical protein [Clostridia bacterium]
MIIKKATVYGFGSLVNCEFIPDNNGILNVSRGLRTDTDLFFEFIRTMLYGHSYKNGVSTRDLFRPEGLVDSRGQKILYGGELIFEACGRNYRLSNFFGDKIEDDFFRIVDTGTGRDLKVDLSRTVGEKTLFISEGAFISAVKDFGASPEVQSGTINLGKLSSLLAVNDGRPTPKDFIQKLRQKLSKLTNSRTKAGEYDVLVAQKSVMTETLEAIEERDTSLRRKHVELEAAENELASVDATIRDNDRIFALCDSARTLLMKDKIMASYDQLLVLMRQLDFAESENTRLVNTKLLPTVILPLISFAAGCALIAGGLSALKETPVGWPIEILGAVFAVIGIVFGIYKLSKFTTRFTLKTDGRVTTYADEAERLKKEIFYKNEELLAMMPDRSVRETLEKWRRSEDVMREANDAERRFAVMKQATELEKTVTNLSATREPLATSIERIQSDIATLTDTDTVGFSEAMTILDGIDARIYELNNDINSLLISINAANTAEKKFMLEVVKPACKLASDIYFKTSGDTAEFNVDNKYNVTAVSSDSVLALLSFRAALSSFTSSESDRQLLFIGSDAAEKPYLDKFMRASGIAQLVVAYAK